MNPNPSDDTSPISDSELETVDCWLRIAQHQQKVRDSVRGNLAIDPDMNRLPPAELERTWKTFAENEDGPTFNLAQRLALNHLPLPPHPARLSNAELGPRLGRLIRDLAEIGVLLEFTDHLSDRQLMHLLVERVMLIPLKGPVHSVTHFVSIYICEFCVNTKEECEQLMLRYYAPEEYLAEFHPEILENLPPGKRPPFNRDSKTSFSKIIDSRRARGLITDDTMFSLAMIGRFDWNERDLQDDAPWESSDLDDEDAPF